MDLVDKTKLTPTDADFADITMSGTKASNWENRIRVAQAQIDAVEQGNKVPPFDILKKMFGPTGNSKAATSPSPIQIPVPKVLPENTSVLIIPQVLCPECSCIHSAEKLADGLRVKFTHDFREGCTRSNTCIIRPLAQFTQFI